jgi:RecA-family ATPase
MKAASWNLFQKQADARQAIGGMTAAELMQKTFPEPRWAVQGILTEGLTILASKPKKGKSLMSMNLGLGITTGTFVLGTIPVEEGSVIVLALEDTNRRLQKRIKRMGADAPESLYLFTKWPRIDEGGLDLLEEKIKLVPDLRLVIIDTLQKIRPPTRGIVDQYRDDYDTVAKIKGIADRQSVCILLIHHLRKMDADDIFDTLSGSLGLTAAADGLLVLESAKGMNTLHITGRDIETSELAMELDPQTLNWKILGERAEVMRTRDQQRVYDALKAATESLELKEIVELSECKRENVRKILKKFMDDGSVQKTERGRYAIRERE